MFQSFLKTPGSLALAIALYAAFAVGVAHAQQGYTVEYQLSAWKTIHFDDARKADLHFRTVKGLGCDAKQDAHGGHIDISYRCPNWRRINLPSDASAHSWERWLRASGFVTKHDH